MKANGLLILVLVMALAAFTGMAWTAGDEKPACTGDGPHGRHGESPACTGDGPHGHHGIAGSHHGAERMAAALDMTDEQAQAVREIMTAERESIHQEMEIVLSDILTPEQLVRLEEIKARHETRGEKGPRDRKGRQGRMEGDRDGMSDQRLDRMTELLDLTADQQESIRQIFEEAAPPARDDMRERINQVLTPEQQEKMEQRMGDRRPGKRGRQARHPSYPGFPQRMADELGLTDEQREAVHTRMDEIRDLRRDRVRSEIDALLTPEQREKLGQLHQGKTGSDN